jgi:Flp pilus assembly protein CpaB
MSSSNTESFVSASILENIEVIDIYDKNGYKINNGRSKNEGTIIDTVTIKVDKNMANILNNLKKYGEFSLTIKR